MELISKNLAYWSSNHPLFSFTPLSYSSLIDYSIYFRINLKLGIVLIYCYSIKAGILAKLRPSYSIF